MNENFTYKFTRIFGYFNSSSLSCFLVNRFSTFLVFFSFTSLSFSQTSIPNTTAVVQTFNSMNATTTTPANWRVRQSVTPTYAAGTTTLDFQASSGSPTGGGTYNWGTTAGTDRALGVMTSGSYASPNSVMGFYRNTNANSINQLAISYKLERYRTNTASASVQFFYSLDGSTWVAVTAGDISSATIGTAASSYSFAPQATFNVASFNITSLSIAANSDIYLRFNLNTTGSSSQGIGIDDVSVTATFDVPANTITTGTLTGAPFAVDCTTADDGTIDFTSTGTFISGNIYTAQLSNSAGSFAAPTSIGTLSSFANSGTIDLTIPAATFNGTSYKIRVISSNPAVTGTETAAFTITLSGGPCGGGGGVLFSETFNEADNSTSGTDNVGGVSWTSICPNSIDANDYSKVVSGVLENRDTNGPATLTSGNIDISSCPSSFYVKLSITSSGDMEPCRVAPGLEEIDFVALELKIDGGSWSSSPGSFNCGATDIYNNTSTIFTTDATSAGSNYNSGCIPTASTLQLKIVAQNWASDEYWRIDNIEVGCTTCVLPITLTYFDVFCKDENALQFNWQTASEYNNDYFQLERSKNGVNFETIDIIDGQGNSSNTVNYSYSTTYNRYDEYYYRLKQVDFNGVNSYSEIRMGTCTYDDEKISVFPNPTIGEFIVSGYEKDSKIIIYDGLGRLIQNIQTNSISTIIDISENSAGIYFVKVQSAAKTETIKINLVH